MKVEELLEKHGGVLDRGIAALRARDWPDRRPWKESELGPDSEHALQRASEWLDGLRGKHFSLDQPGQEHFIVGPPQSPWGTDLGISHHKLNPRAVIDEVKKAMPGVMELTLEARLGLALEILSEVQKYRWEFTLAVKEVTGQPLLMAEHASTSHVWDRFIETVALASLLAPISKSRDERIGKEGRGIMRINSSVIPKGPGLVICCGTFPLWNSIAGIVANFIVGAATVIKPNPRAILPLALFVRIAREVLQRNGCDPNAILMAADTVEDPITEQLLRADVWGTVDYTGGSQFGRRIPELAPAAECFLEMDGTNLTILDSTFDDKSMSRSFALAQILYSMQLCTASQKLLIPANGITVNGSRMTFAEVLGNLIAAVDGLLGKAANKVLGCIQSPDILERIQRAAVGTAGEQIVKACEPVALQDFPNARTLSPLFIQVEADDAESHLNPTFGPMLHIIRTRDTDQSLALVSQALRMYGGLRVVCHSTEQRVIEEAMNIAAGEDVHPFVNPIGETSFLPSPAFDTFHGGNNRACNTAFGDIEFIRRRIKGVRQSHVLSQV